MARNNESSLGDLRSNQGYELLLAKNELAQMESQDAF